MLKNIFRISLRSFFKNKTFSLINIIGFAIGMAASLLIALWVFDELSYDRFHENTGRIYRVERYLYLEGKRLIVPVTAPPYGKALKSDYPEIEDMTRLYPMNFQVKDTQDNSHLERITVVDDSFFNIFSFPLLRGNPDNALKEAFTAVITEEAALKYFGNDDPINKSLEIDWNGRPLVLKVNGLIEDVPQNSHFHFDILVSISTLETFDNTLDYWMNNYLYTYVLLKENSNVQALEAKFDGFVKKYLETELAQYIKFDDISEIYELKLKPIEDIHLGPPLLWEIEGGGSRSSVIVFSVVSILILLIASFNFMNLSTALAAKRAMEVAVRKAAGAHRRQLIIQFLGESLFYALFSFVIALLIIELCLPGFNNFTNKSLSMISLFDSGKIALIASIILGTALISGLYPAIYLSSFKPIKILKGDSWGQYGKKLSFRQILVTLQFGISIALIIGSISVYLQLEFFSNKPLGFNKKNIILLPFEGKMLNSYDSFREELLKNPLIQGVCASSNVPGSRKFSDCMWTTELSDEKSLNCQYIRTDRNFLDTYKINIIEGRGFHKHGKESEQGEYLVNEAFLRKIGVHEPAEVLGKKFMTYGAEYNGRIIGVMKDFHYKSLNNKIEPLVIFPDSNFYLSNISVRFIGDKSTEAIKYLEETWKEYYKGIVFNYEFVENRFNNLYNNEERLKKVLLGFTILAILIACLGLFGLAAYTARIKTKEIGIRKVLGGTSSQIILKLSKEFAKWVIISNIIAWPIAYFISEHWLNNYPYRINTAWWLYIASGMLALIIAILTVSFQSWKASRKNPTEAIKYE